MTSAPSRPWGADSAAEAVFAHRAGMPGRGDRQARQLRPWHRWLGLGFCVLLCAVFTAAAVSALRDASRLEQHGVTTTGEVVRVDSWGKHRDYDVRFVLRTGETVVHQAEDRAGRRRDGLAVGDTVTITYDERDPSFVTRRADRLRPAFWGCAVIAVLCIPGGVAWEAYARRQLRRAAAH